MTPETLSNRKPSILLLEADDAVRELLADVLEDSGFAVLEAANGEDAIERARETPIDLVIADLVMPDPSGMATISALAAERPHLRVMILSGCRREAYQNQTEELKGVATLRKPFSLDAILRAVAAEIAARDRC